MNFQHIKSDALRYWAEDYCARRHDEIKAAKGKVTAFDDAVEWWSEEAWAGWRRLCDLRPKFFGHGFVPCGLEEAKDLRRAKVELLERRMDKVRQGHWTFTLEANAIVDILMENHREPEESFL